MKVEILQDLFKMYLTLFDTIDWSRIFYFLIIHLNLELFL